ncbi:MAG TPA: transporter [Pyrinomonadaceae bacterium]|nr:transporter [Pyrinomonadaceae bacterium]
MSAVGSSLIKMTFALCCLSPAVAQQPHPAQVSSLKDVPVTDSLAAVVARGRNGAARRAPAVAAQSEEEEFIKPDRPTLASPAEIQKPGVLQVEFGYDGDFRSDEFRAEHTSPLSLRFAASSRLLLAFEIDSFKSETDRETRERRAGVGDARLGFQLVALKEAAAHPALAFAYRLKLPTASERKQLGTGRFDHELLFLLSKKLGKTDLDFNAGLLANGEEGGPGWEHGGLAAFAVSREFENDFGVEAEISGMSIDARLPRGLYALGSLNYRVSRRLRLDWGVRLGLNPEAPRVGVFGGLSVGVADLYKRGK